LRDVTIEDVVRLCQGEEGTTLDLKILKGNRTKFVGISLVRREWNV
jgi:hypothetical protein